ncbi:hypothetical protein G5I_14561 [Acromyrmex echinatior]|uniref:Uncharacterized protein n=1 Tax=Acromyrmex echinatior TaxID=103372 RepID=F4X825_ACREC|nr:hypothetical protein G5I_14561 [Acromyrmex echinatior]
MELEVVGAVNVRRLMVCTPAIKSLEQRTEIKGKENRRVRRTGGRGGGDGGQRGEVGERTMRRGSYACTHTAANTGETGLRNDFTGITPAKSGRYGAAKCDVVIRHSRGLRCPRLPGRPTACRFARVFSSPHAQVLGSFARAVELSNTVSWMHCHLIMDSPMSTLIVLLDKTDNPDDSDPGRQVGAFLTANSWKRILHPPLTWTGARFLPYGKSWLAIRLYGQSWQIAWEITKAKSILSCQKESAVLQRIGDKVAVTDVNIRKNLLICMSKKQQFLNARKELEGRKVL